MQNHPSCLWGMPTPLCCSWSLQSLPWVTSQGPVQLGLAPSMAPPLKILPMPLWSPWCSPHWSLISLSSCAFCPLTAMLWPWLPTPHSPCASHHWPISSLLLSTPQSNTWLSSSGINGMLVCVHCWAGHMPCCHRSFSTNCIGGTTPGPPHWACVGWLPEIAEIKRID